MFIDQHISSKRWPDMAWSTCVWHKGAELTNLSIVQLQMLAKCVRQAQSLDAQSTVVWERLTYPSCGFERKH